MPAKSKQQFKLVQTLRSKYTDISNTPDKFKWVWKDDWIKDVDYQKLPTKVESESSLFDMQSVESIKSFFINKREIRA